MAGVVAAALLAPGCHAGQRRLQSLPRGALPDLALQPSLACTLPSGIVTPRAGLVRALLVALLLSWFRVLPAGRTVAPRLRTVSRLVLRRGGQHRRLLLWLGQPSRGRRPRGHDGPRLDRTGMADAAALMRTALLRVPAPAPGVGAGRLTDDGRGSRRGRQPRSARVAGTYRRWPLPPPCRPSACRRGPPAAAGGRYDPSRWRAARCRPGDGTSERPSSPKSRSSTASQPGATT